MTEGLPAGLCWLAFDLDDTLHYFRRASSHASEAVLRAIQQDSGIELGSLDQAYREILQTAQSGHFVQPKTSREYREERFGALLGRFDQDAGPSLDRILDLYDAALADALTLKPGARESLAAAKRVGLSVMVISEGPQDAQETTIDRLGIGPSIDLLVTSAGERASKTNGLFERALDRADCGRCEILYVGDSIDRDIVPTVALGIASVYTGEQELPEDVPALKIDLAKLSRLVDSLCQR
jgi:putative hydrolase of the HAD superfamily